MSMDNPASIASQTAYEEAAQAHLGIVLPKRNELQIDIDSEEAYAHFQKMLGVVQHWMEALVTIDKPSRSGLPKRHITVKLTSDLTPLERIALQAILGSDLKREFFGYMRIKQGDFVPTLFLER